MPTPTSTRTTGIKRLFRCPYCPRNGGVIGIDVDAVLAVRPGGATEVTLDLNEDPRQGLLVFDPDAAGGRPCPHLMDISVYGFVNRKTGAGRPERVLDFGLDWKHPWFVQHDPDATAHQFLWEVVLGDEYPSFRPDGPYRVRWTGSYRRVPGSDFRLSVTGCFITALEPVKFVGQLLDGDRRLQDFWSREGGAET